MLRDLQGNQAVEPIDVDGLLAYPQGNGSSWLRLRSSGSAPQAVGKYLFFSSDPHELLALACDELRGHGFVSAKVSVKPSASNEHCLCLYWSDDSRGVELLARHSRVKFRGFKTDAETRAGVYSEEFLRARDSAS